MLVSCLVSVLISITPNDKIITETVLTGTVNKKFPNYVDFSKDAAKHKDLIGDYSDVHISNLKCVYHKTNNTQKKGK